MSLARLCLVSSCLLLCSTCVTAAARETRSSSSRHDQDEEHAHGGDQNVRFMLSLYRSAAEPDGRPKQHRKFGTNTVRLLRPAACTVRQLPAASRDHHYTFTVQYQADTGPSEQLLRASFIHLRSSFSPSPPPPSPPPPRCRATITSLGPESLVTLEPHQQWTETDITAHVSAHMLQSREREGGEHLTLTAQYLCSSPGNHSNPWRWSADQRKEPHLEVPSLLLYLEEARDGKAWMEEVLGENGRSIMRRVGRWHPLLRRRRSKEPSQLTVSSLAILKNASPSPHTRRKGGASRRRCKLHSFSLSFSELGWSHHFLAPPVYNPRFCQGDCLFPYVHSSNHAVIQTLINQMGVADVPPPSCVPYAYMPMSVLVVHKKQVEYRELDDMVAESCTCR